MLDACFRILEAGVPEELWRWFCSSPPVCVSLIPHEVPDEELCLVGISILTVWSFSLWMHADSKRKVHMTMVFGIRIVTAVKIWMLPGFQYVTVQVASALLYMEDKWHALRMVVGGCGQQDCMRGSRNASHFSIFGYIWGIFRVCFCTAPTDTSYQAPVRQNLRFLHPPSA